MSGPSPSHSHAYAQVEAGESRLGTLTDESCFRHQCARLSLSPKDSNKYVTETILRTANSSVPQTPEKLPNRSRPWWNRECDSARKRYIHA